MRVEFSSFHQFSGNVDVRWFCVAFCLSQPCQSYESGRAWRVGLGPKLDKSFGLISGPNCGVKEKNKHIFSFKVVRNFDFGKATTNCTKQ